MNTLQFTEQPATTKNYPAQNVNCAELKHAALSVVSSRKFFSDISKNSLGTFLNVVIILLRTSEKPRALVSKSLGFGVSISDFEFNSFGKILSLGFLTANVGI